MKAYVVSGEGATDTCTSTEITEKSCTNTSAIINFPDNNWEDIRKAFGSSRTMAPSFDFITSHIIFYFMTRSVVDGKKAGDTKSMNKLADNLFYLWAYAENPGF